MGANRLADSVGESMSAALFCQLLFSAAELAMLFFVLNETNASSITNSVAIIAVSVVLMPSFVVCLLSEKVTGRLQAIGDGFCECAWYRLSAEQQQLFLLPIKRAQKECRLNGLGIVDCSLAVFASVNHFRNDTRIFPKLNTNFDTIFCCLLRHIDYSDCFFVFVAAAQLEINSELMLA